MFIKDTAANPARLRAVFAQCRLKRPHIHDWGATPNLKQASGKIKETNFYLENLIESLYAVRLLIHLSLAPSQPGKLDMASTALSRKDLKQPDVVQKSMYRIVNYIYLNRQVFIAIVVAFVILILAVFAWVQYYQAEQIKQANLFNSVQKVLLNPALGSEDRQRRALDNLANFLKEYPSSSMTPLALMYKASIHVANKDWSNAEVTFKNVIQIQDAPATVLNSAKLNLANVYVNLNQLDLATQTVESINDDTWKDMKQKSLAQIEIVRGNKAAAKQILQDLINSIPQDSESTSLLRREASDLLMSIN